jgi:uncharacterized protein YjbJ (UPF0337 family)
MGAHIKSKWAKLTDDDLRNLDAKKDDLVAKLQERYGILKDDAERQVDEWLAKLSPRHDAERGSAQTTKGSESNTHSKTA